MLRHTTHLGKKPHREVRHCSGKRPLIPGQAFTLVMLNNKVKSLTGIMFCQMMSIPWLSLYWKLGEEGILGKYHLHSIAGGPGSSPRHTRAQAPAVLFLKPRHSPHGKRRQTEGGEVSSPSVGSCVADI